MRLNMKAIDDFTVLVAIGIIFWQVFSLATGRSFFFQKCPQVELERAYLVTLSARKAIGTSDIRATGTKTTIIIGGDIDRAQELGMKEAKKILPMEYDWAEHKVAIEELKPEFLAHIIKK